jgi:hypothetical protein
MLKIIQHFGKHCSCHLQHEYVMVVHFWKLYTGQAVGGKLHMMMLNGGAKEWAAIQQMELSMWLRKEDNQNFLRDMW